MKNLLVYLGIYVLGFASPFILGTVIPWIIDYLDTRRNYKRRIKETVERLKR